MSDRLIGLILFGIAALAAWQSRDLMPPWLILAGGVALAWWSWLWLCRRAGIAFRRPPRAQVRPRNR